jgi:hypothetical protein
VVVLHEATERLRVAQLGVGVQEQVHVAGGRACGFVQRVHLAHPAGRRPLAAQNAQPGRGVLLEDGSGVVVGAVVVDDDLDLGVRLIEKRGQEPTQVIGFVARGHQNGHGGPRGGRFARAPAAQVHHIADQHDQQRGVRDDEKPGEHGGVGAGARRIGRWV